MKSRFLRGGIAITACALSQAALGNDADVAEFTPPRIVQRPDNFDNCHVQVVGDLGKKDEPTVNFTIAEDGTFKNYSLPDGSPDWMKELSRCVLEQLRFSPGTRQGQVADLGAFVAIKFRARSPDPSAGIAIEKVDSLVTPPLISRRSRDTDGCYPDRIARLGEVSRFLVTITILADGSVTDMTLPVGSEPWQDEAARCMLGRLVFVPGTRDGLPVAAQATIPFVMQIEGGKVIPPELRSTGEELEAAYRACIPSDLLTMASAFYSFDIATNGKVSNPKVVKGTGDPRLDEAGACILKMLEFTPLMQNGRGMRSHATWELPLRPHR
jgi:hypothetical protein